MITPRTRQGCGSLEFLLIILISECIYSALCLMVAVARGKAGIEARHTCREGGSWRAGQQLIKQEKKEMSVTQHGSINPAFGREENKVTLLPGSWNALEGSSGEGKKGNLMQNLLNRGF